MHIFNENMVTLKTVNTTTNQILLNNKLDIPPNFESHLGLSILFSV